MTLVRTLLIHGCPIAAIVAAYGLDERTVRAWLHKAGAHAALLHDQMGGGVEARRIQADEIRVRVRGGTVWAAIALDVGSRLWLATAVARRRDGLLIHLLLRRTLVALADRAFLLAVDGVARDVGAARSLVRMPERPWRHGRPPLVWPQGCALAQVVKAGLRRGEGIVRRVVVGTEATVVAALATSHGGTTITTAYSERLNATVRERLARAPPACAGPGHGPRRERVARAAAGVQLVLGARVPPPARHRHGSPLGRADARDGRRTGHPPLRPGRGAADAGASGPPHGTRRTPAWATIRARARDPVPVTVFRAPRALRRMITVTCGYTANIQDLYLCTFREGYAAKRS